MIEYKITKYKPNPESDEELQIILDKEYLYVQAFLNSIYEKEMGEWVLESVDRVLNGNSEIEERNTADFLLKIKKEKSVASDMHAFDKGETLESTIPTKDLRELVVVWTKAIDEFNKEKASK